VRTDGRQFNELRKVTITPNASEYAEGSVLVEFGKTKVLCTASLDENLPKWLQNTGKGWVTAEYGMLPRSTHTRIKRDKSMNSGRTQEIARLIGRSLRAAVDLRGLSETQIIVDCDVIQADGGTRTASVTGGFVALALALKKLHALSEIKTIPLVQYVSAISVGLKNNSPFLDLNYDEDSSIETDMNFVLTNKLEFVEIQGTAEGTTFSQKHLTQMVDVATTGCIQLFREQEKIVGSFYPLKMEI
jgi:ribonuclease PH